MVVDEMKNAVSTEIKINEFAISSFKRNSLRYNTRNCTLCLMRIADLTIRVITTELCSRSKITVLSSLLCALNIS